MKKEINKLKKDAKSSGRNHDAKIERLEAERIKKMKAYLLRKG